jgi:hypothetical protein
MKADLDRLVAPLAGLPLRDHARESNMLALHFGDGDGAHALRVYCAWRLTRGDAVVAGSADLFTPADPDEDLETFDYEAPGATWWDVRWRAYVDGAASAPVVVSAHADAFGGLRLALSDGAVFEAFPNSAPAEHFETEFWSLARGGAPAAAVGTGGVEGAGADPAGADPAGGR